jgi:hypothetical protein
MERITGEPRKATCMSSPWVTSRRVARILVMSVILTAGSPAAAGAQAGLTDPAGDARKGAPAFMDIVAAEASQSGHVFRFQMSVVAPIPAAPPPTPPGTNQIQWDWSLNTDPTSFPAGSPFPAGPGQGRPAEFIIHVVWDGSSFSAHLTDRRPLLSGGEAVVTPLAFTISGTTVRVDLSASLLDKPSSFLWGPVTFYWSSPPGGTAGGHFVDSLEPFYNPFPA